MRWGFPLDRKLVINARLETAAEKPMFRESFRQRRCLIPASGWFEWDHREKKPPRYRFRVSGSRWFCLAGLYRVLPMQPPVFAVVTRPAEGPLAEFHDRMPLWFPPAQAGRWLDGAADAADSAGRVTDLCWEKEDRAAREPVQIGLFDDFAM
jgi:putative SOS response-associated peptidase YedK